MKATYLAAAMVAATLAFAPPSQGAAQVTAANLAVRCAKDASICDKAIKWIYDNTSACSDARLGHDVVVKKVVAWLKAHPKQKAADDNALAGTAIEALWPCHL